MTPFEKLHTFNEFNLEKANQIIIEKKISKLPIINKQGKLISLICRKDIIGHREYPLASKEKNQNNY